MIYNELTPTGRNVLKHQSVYKANRVFYSYGSTIMRKKGILRKKIGF